MKKPSAKEDQIIIHIPLLGTPAFVRHIHIVEDQLIEGLPA